MLKHDPYLLIRHLKGYGFKKVDQIALKLGVSKTQRILRALAPFAHHPGRACGVVERDGIDTVVETPGDPDDHDRLRDLHLFTVIQRP